MSADVLRTSSNDPELLTVDDVARWLNVSKGWVYGRARRGELPSGLVGKHLRFRRSDVEAFIERTFS